MQSRVKCLVKIRLGFAYGVFFSGNLEPRFKIYFARRFIRIYLVFDSE